MSSRGPAGSSIESGRPGRKIGCLIGLWGAVACTVLVLILVPLLGLFNSQPLDPPPAGMPLTADGKHIDYFAVLQQERTTAEVATEDNGFRSFFQQVKMPVQGEDWHFREVCRCLGLDPDAVKPTQQYTEPSSFLTAEIMSDDFDWNGFSKCRAQADTGDASSAEGSTPSTDQPTSDNESSGALAADQDDAAVANDQAAERMDALDGITKQLDAPWTLGDLPMMEAWLENNGPTLDLLGESAAKPQFYLPMVRQSEDEPLIALGLYNLQGMRGFGRGLSCRANYRIATGDIDGAIDDIIALKRLGRHISYGDTMIHGLVGIALEGIAASIGIGGSADHPPSREQLERFVREIAAMRPRAPFQSLFGAERYMGLELIQRLASGGEMAESLREYLELPEGYEYAALILGIDWNRVLQRYNEQFERISAQQEPDYPKADLSSALSRRRRSEWLADWLAATLVPSGTAQEAWHRAQCSDQAQQITLAMLMYQREHGTLPPAYTVDSDGQPLHSWRVLLLPYLGQQALYDQIDLASPWSSDAHRALREQHVAVYRCPALEATLRPGETGYSVIVGPRTAFHAEQGKTLDSFGGQSQHLLLVTERAVPVCWMDPNREIPEADALQGIFSQELPDDLVTLPANGVEAYHSYCAICGMRDGSVQMPTLSREIEGIQQIVLGTGRLVDY